jgi:hypothetical protein
MPALSTTKPKAVSEEKYKERLERKRLADYSLKPRFDYAFGSWGGEQWRWLVDGECNPGAR